MDLILDLDKRSGRLLGPFIALYSVERLALPDFVPDGTTVALLTPSGETLALALSQGHAVTLDTNTTQAAAYAAGLPVGRSLNAFVVVGDTDNLLATVPVLVVANALDALAPPTQSAPHYPTSAELQSILNEMTEQAAAVSKAAKAVAQDAQRVENLVNVNLPKAVEEIDTHLDERVRAAETAIEKAATDASETLSDAAKSASNALDGKVATASTALENKLAAAQTALDGKVSSANNASTAADGSAKAAAKARDDAEASANRAEVALNNGCEYEVRDVADATIGLDKTLTAYKHAPTGDTSYTFNAPTDAQGKIVVFWLWILMGETAHALTFPPSVTWLSEPSFAPNTQTLLAFMSVDGGATWTANVQWEA